MSKKKNRQQRTQIPDVFLERLTTMFGVSLFREIEKTFVERPTTFRVNTVKALNHDTTKSLTRDQGAEDFRKEVLSILRQNGFKFNPVPWYRDAFVLLNKSKRDLTGLDIYNEGDIYIQSLASMVPPLILDPKPGEKVLDLTAAPGSKTSQIAALMQCEGELVANDKNKVRFFKLKHNLTVLGVIPQNDVSSSEPLPHLPLQGEGVWFLQLRMEHGASLCREYPNYFDKILLDAPCSAEARFIASDPKTFGYWKERKIKEMAYTQWKLLLSAWHSLKPGGTLVYSTCTYAPEENESQISKFLDRNADAHMLPVDLVIPRLPIVKQWKNTLINPEVQKNALRIKPTTMIEGFFVAKIKKE